MRYFKDSYWTARFAQPEVVNVGGTRVHVEQLAKVLAEKQRRKFLDPHTEGVSEVQRTGP